MQVKDAHVACALSDVLSDKEVSLATFLSASYKIAVLTETYCFCNNPIFLIWFGIV